MPGGLCIERIAVAVMWTGGSERRREAGATGKEPAEWWILDLKEGGGKTMVMGMCSRTTGVLMEQVV